MTILPLAYLPSVEYCARLLRGDCVVDLGEHFVKRSERNRARILVPNGVMEMTAQVCHANRPCTPMREVLLDYSKRWQHQHWTALVSSYKASPYFDHYAARFEPFYRTPSRYLVDYNQALLEVLLDALNIPMPRLSEGYIDATAADLDLRSKHKKGSDDFSREPYF
ncbi:MAG: WbqC family protein, partial [Alistipes sp.]